VNDPVGMQVWRLLVCQPLMRSWHVLSGQLLSLAFACQKYLVMCHVIADPLSSSPLDIISVVYRLALLRCACCCIHVCLTVHYLATDRQPLKKVESNDYNCSASGYKT
jgi:hypothetical protein